MRYDRGIVARGQSHRRGSVLLVVLGVLTVLSLIGISFVLFARTESTTARNYRTMAQADLVVEGEIERVRAALLDDLYPARGPDTGTSWRLWGESHDYAGPEDAWLFGMTGDGSAVKQVSFGGTSAPTADSDTRDTPDAVNDSVWRTIRLSDGSLARVAALVMDHGGLANLNVWGNTQNGATEIHNPHQGLHPHELNLMRVLWPDPMADDERDTYWTLFYGRETPDGPMAGRYGYLAPGSSIGPGAAGLDDDQDSAGGLGAGLTRLDDDADDAVDEVNEALDEPDEYCVSNPGGTADDRDRPFDSVDLWELLHNRSFRSRFEVLAGAFDLDAPFAPSTRLGSYRRNLTTLSADPQWVGPGAMDTDDRLRLRVDLNHATSEEYETAFRQAGFADWEARQMMVNLVDCRDGDDNVTRHPDDPTIFGHERQPFVNEVFFATWRPPGWGPPPGHGPTDGNGWSQRIAVAIELYNPYDTDIDLYRWELRVDLEGDSPDSQVFPIDDGIDGSTIPAGGYVTLISSDSDAIGGGLNLAVDGKAILLVNGDFIPWPKEDHVYRIRFVRACLIGDPPSPENGELIVDDTGAAIDFSVLDLPTVTSPPHPGHGGPVGPPPGAEWQGLDLFRRDAEVNLFERTTEEHPEPTLGAWNVLAEEATKPARLSVPIPNRGAGSFASVADLGQVLNYTQNGDQPYTDDYALTNPDQIERGIKFDLSGDWYQGGTDLAADYAVDRAVLDLFCVNRPDHDGLDNDADGVVDNPAEAEWPIYGRLNINTASQAMLERALWRGPYPTAAAKEKATLLAHEIVKRRETIGPFTHVGDLFRGADLAAALAQWALDGADNDGDAAGIGAGEAGEKDERDAAFRCLANLVTTRSNVFTVFVTAEIYRDMNGNGTIDEGVDERTASRKAVVVLDRTQAAMTVKYAEALRVPYVTSPVLLRQFRWISD